MVRRSPAEYYLKYLISHPSGFDNDHIRDVCRMQNILFIGMPYLERLRRMATPNPFYPENLTHSRSQRFIVRERIHQLYHPDDDVAAALNILEKPRQKMALEALLIARSADEYVAAAMRSRDGVDMSARAVGLYKHFFFNIELVDSEELRALLELPQVSGTPDPDQAALERLLNAQRRRDPRVLNARLEDSYMARIMEGLRRGFLPTNVDLGKLASTARTAALVQVVNSTLQGQSERARDFALTAKMVTEMLEDIGSPVEDLQGELAQMLLVTEEGQTPQLRQLPPPDAIDTTGEAHAEFEVR